MDDSIREMLEDTYSHNDKARADYERWNGSTRNRNVAKHFQEVRARTRRVLQEMNDKAERAIDLQVAASTPMMPRK